MRTIFRLGWASFALIAALGTLPSRAADQQLPTLNVAKTQNSGVAGWQPAMGEGLGQMFVTELTKVPNFKVLESLALEDLRDERRLGESGEVAASESVKKGQWKGSDYTFKSTVTRFGAKSSSYGGGGVPIPTPFGIGGGGVRINKSEHDVQIDWRIIDNATREIVASGRGEGKEKGGGFDFSSWSGGGFNNNREFMDSALGKATMKAIAVIMTDVKKLSLAPGARTAGAAKEAGEALAAQRNIKGIVKLVEGRQVWVSFGSNNKFEKGDKVRIYAKKEKRNSKGEVVATTYELVGEIVLSKVQKEMSMGEYTGTAQIAEDMVAVHESVDIEKLE